jgi:hypothetical protein
MKNTLIFIYESEIVAIHLQNTILLIVKKGMNNLYIDDLDMMRLGCLRIVLVLYSMHFYINKMCIK